jgi:hypothetical protein
MYHNSGGLPMSRSVFLSGLLSTLVPGLGQIYSGNSQRGALILFASILIGNLNAIWLSLYSTTSPGPEPFWTFKLPLMLHEMSGVWGVMFWIWQIVDAVQQTKKQVYNIMT